VVASHKHLDRTIANLAAMSAASLDVLARIQTEVDAALEALQFEAALNQLLQSITEKLEAVRTACRSGDVAQLADLEARSPGAAAVRFP
jgi:hypothetical protein